jgi:SNF2 family DNA or RNA helicase
MGMGKSCSTLSALDDLYFIGAESMPTLVIAPLRVAQSTWPDEAAKWEHLRGMEVVPILGSASQRATALNRDAPIFTINYENIPWLVDWFKHNPRPWPFGTVVADESTKLKGYRTRQGTQRAQALAEVARKKVHRWINLTGTPAPNGLKDLWGQTWFLDGGERLGRSFNAFQQRWFQSIPGAQGYQNIRPLAHAQTEIQDRLRDICLTLDPRDWFDLDEPIVRNVEVELPGAVRALYRKFEREMFMEIDGSEVEAFNAASRTMKCLQLANGAVYTDDDGAWKEVHDVKIQALEDIVEEAAGMPVLVAYNFKSDLARLTKAFPKGRVLDQNPQTIRDWNVGKIPILFTHPASAGHGLNLQDGGNILVFFGLNWNLEEHQQIIERIGPVRQKQAGHDRPTWIYRIVARATVDELVLERLDTKRDVQDILLNAMKRKAA